MKRFIFSILSVAVFFVGLGAIVDKVGARFKSDDKAVELIRQARLAIGGDQAIAGIRSMTISGKTSHTFTINGGGTTYTISPSPGTATALEASGVTMSAPSAINIAR